MIFDRQSPRALIFDLDGTLYFLGPLRRRMFGRLLMEISRRPVAGSRAFRIVRCYRKAQEVLRTDAQAHAKGVNLGDAQIQLASDWSGCSFEETALAVSRWMEESPLSILRHCLRPGIVEFLHEARRRSIATAVVSDYPAGRKLEALGLSHLFDEVICAQDPDVQVLKPHPRGLETVVRRLGVSPGEAVYIGDRPDIDGVCAERAGISSVIIGGPPHNTRRGGHVAVRDYQELADLLWFSANSADSVEKEFETA